MNQKQSPSIQSGFTLLEIAVVISLLIIVTTLVGSRIGTFEFINERGFIRKLSETISFLHFQSVADQKIYQLELNLDERYFKVGELNEIEGDNTQLAKMLDDAGVLTLELTAMLNPALNSGQLFSDPTEYPSLAEKVFLPTDMLITDVVTMRGKVLPSALAGKNDDDEGGSAFIRFSPRGFSEFAVIHLRLRDDSEKTLLINSFTGGVEILEGYKEFEWLLTNERTQGVNS